MGEKSQAKHQPFVGVLKEAAHKAGEVNPETGKINQAELSRNSGASESAISRAFSDGKDISGENLWKLLVYYDLLKNNQTTSKEDYVFLRQQVKQLHELASKIDKNTRSIAYHFKMPQSRKGPSE